VLFTKWHAAGSLGTEMFYAKVALTSLELKCVGSCAANTYKETKLTHCTLKRKQKDLITTTFITNNEKVNFIVHITYRCCICISCIG